MAKRLAINHGDIAVRVIGKRDFSLFPRVQRFNIDFRQNAQDIDELGNSGKAGVSKRAPTITVGIDTYDASIKNFAVLTGTDPNAYPASGVEITKLTEVDIAGLVKDKDVADIAKSVFLEKAQVSDVNWRFSVDGEAEENYSFSSVRRVWFRNELRTEKFTTGATSFALSDTPIQLKNGNWILSVVLDGERLVETTNPTPGTGEYYYNSGTNTVVTGDTRTQQVLITYQTNTPSLDWVEVSDTTYPASVSGRDNKIVIAANDIPRVQSVDIRVNLNPEEVKELGNRQVAGYNIKPPVIEGSLTVLDTDTELIELFTTGSTGGSDTEFEPGIGCTTATIDLKIRIYAPCDVNQSGVLKTIYLPSIELIGDTYTANVGNSVQQVFNFKSKDGRLVVYSGLY